MVIHIEKPYHVGVKLARIAVVKSSDSDEVTVDLYKKLVDGVPMGLLEQNHVFKYKGRGKDCPFSFPINDKSDDCT